MKISAQEEFGLRILIRVAQSKDGLSINEISLMEGITKPNVAKICRVLRIAGFLSSEKGHAGGYQLAKHPSEIGMKELLNSLDKPIYGKGFCVRFSEEGQLCTKSIDCSVRSLWSVLQSQLDFVLEKLTLQDMLGKEKSTQQNICETTGVEYRF